MPAINPQRGFGDLGRSGLWRPTVVARIGGSKWVQAQPARSAAAVGTGPCPAVANGCRLSLPDRRPCGAVPPVFPQTKNLEALIYGRQIRAAPAAAVGTGPCPVGGSSWQSALPTRRRPVLTFRARTALLQQCKIILAAAFRKSSRGAFLRKAASRSFPPFPPFPPRPAAPRRRRCRRSTRGGPRRASSGT